MIEHIPVSINTLAPFVDKYGYLAVGDLVALENIGVTIQGDIYGTIGSEIARGYTYVMTYTYDTQ